MTKTELREARLEILDRVHALSGDPLGDAEAVRELVNEFFERLEAELDGEEEG